MTNRCQKLAVAAAGAVVATVFLVCFSGKAIAQFARLTLQSEPGDYIGQGGIFDITYTPQNSYYFSPQIRRTLGGSPAELLFVLGSVTSGVDNTFALLFFGTDQLGIPIQPGFYSNAERADFASPGHPGLDVSFQNRGLNTLTGQFTIDSVTFAPDASAPSGVRIETFGARFEQRAQANAPKLSGTFTYNASSTPTQSVPEPGNLAGLTGLAMLGKAKLTKRKLKFLRKS
jgi:hypothetical protein